ncbi:unnamed protein product [Anisakis simplex]|uniref:G_PROTEIN_RECEP_F1_2 domain-containing protein n=1 Tax=Anisakis simplex TaxID=6269 RepID=A0A0M3J481_ANISI|nr:unnamed protein product [Anisakis simplex]
MIIIIPMKRIILLMLIMLVAACYVRSGTSLDSQFVFNVGVIVFCFTCLIISIICYTALIRVISRYLSCHKYLVKSNGFLIGEQKRTHKHILKRNKYVIVIGSVIMIYTVYLISYSAIQFLYVSRLTRFKKILFSFFTRSMFYLRWIFQSLMCLHSLLQPLCYFRMREFLHRAASMRPNDQKYGDPVLQKKSR